MKFEAKIHATELVTTTERQNVVQTVFMSLSLQSPFTRAAAVHRCAERILSGLGQEV